MTQAEVEQFVAGFNNVQRTEDFGYSFFFVGDDHRLPFVTPANSDSDFDNVSKLNREGVFRVNIGVSRETFENLIAEPNLQAIDYSGLNVFLPHPHYSRQYFVRMLNPSGKNVAATKKLIVEAHSIAAGRLQRKARNQNSKARA